MERLSNQVKLDVVSLEGKWLRHHIIRNSMLVELAPDLLEPPRPARAKDPEEPYWRGVGIIVVDLKKGRTPESAAVEAADFERSVWFNGREHKMYFGWGSNAKDLRVFGLTRDVLMDAGVLHTWETAMRFRRHVTESGYYGFGRGSAKIRVVPKDFKLVLDGLLRPMGDGCGYISRRYWEQIKNDDPDIEPQEAGTPAKASPQAIERIDLQLPGVWEELLPHIEQQLADLDDFQGYWASVTGGTFDLRREAVNAGLPASHPWCWEGWRLDQADRMRRASTAVALDGAVQYIAVPCLSPVISRLGWWQLLRYPIQSPGNQRCVEVTEVEMGEQDWLDRHEAIQYTLTATDWSISAKGMFIIVDELPEGLDILLCREDIKLSTTPNMKTARAVEYRETEIVLAASAHIAAGGLLGVNYELWEGFGGDYDGDRIFIAPVGGMPNFIKAHQLMSGPPETIKLDKEKNVYSVRGPDIRSKMLLSAASPMLGQAVNFFSVLAGAQPANTSLAEHLEVMAKAGGWESSELMMKWFDDMIRVPTDWLKQFIEAAPYLKQLGAKMGKIQDNPVFAIPNWPAFLYWKRFQQAFREWIPDLGHPPQWIMDKLQGQDRSFRASQYLAPMFWHGSIGTIFRYTRERLLPYMDRVMPRDTLWAYLDWADPVSQEELRIAQQFHANYLDFQAGVDWADDDSVKGLRTWINAEVARSKLSRERMVHALWRVSHSSGSPLATGSVVFCAFPQETREIIRAGLKRPPADTIETGLLGLRFQLPAYKGEVLSLPVRVVKFDEMGPKKRPRRRFALTGQVVGQIQPTRKGYPADMLGVIPLEGYQVPDVGDYQAEIRPSPDLKDFWYVTLKWIATGAPADASSEAPPD